MFKFLHFIILIDFLSSLICFLDSLEIYPLISIEYVVLEHEDEVEYHGYDGKEEFDDVETTSCREVDKWLISVPVI